MSGIAIIPRNPSRTFIALNPHLFGGMNPKKVATIIAKASTKSPMAEKFETLWEEMGGPPLTPEFKFHGERRWRADYAHERSRILIELDGGIFGVGKACPKCGRRQQAGHGTAKGFAEDCEKLNAASALGFRVFRICTGMITRENLQPIMDTIRDL